MKLVMELGSLARLGWARLSFFRAIEMLMVRGGDALTAVLLILSLSIEKYALLIVAQSICAGLLFLFRSPAQEFSEFFPIWKAAGNRPLASRLASIRLGSWFLLIIAVVASFALAHLCSFFGEPREWFWAFIRGFLIYNWGFACGADREWIRAELGEERLARYTLIQKGLLVALTAGVFALRHDSIKGFSLAVALSVIVHAWIVARAVRAQLGRADSLKLRYWTMQGEIKDRDQFWSFMSGYLWNFGQSCDLFILALCGVPASMIGFYGIALKLAHLLLFVPEWLRGLLGTWLSARDESDLESERLRLRESVIIFTVIGLISSLISLLLSPVLFKFLSHGRWDPIDVQRLYVYLSWFLATGVILSLVMIPQTWLNLRREPRRVFLRVLIPGWTISALAYAYFAQAMRLEALAAANFGSALILTALTIFEYKSVIFKPVERFSAN